MRKCGNTGSIDPHLFPSPGCAYACMFRFEGSAMKKTFLFIAIALMSANAFAQSATTKANYFACTTEEYLDDIMSFLIAKDMDSADAYINSNKCVILKAGLKTSITDGGWTRSQFSFRGLKMWTVNEAFKLE
jgi:hypothetical protein